MKITREIVQVALEHYGGVRAARHGLRSEGYKFDNAVFTELAQPEQVKPEYGVVSAPDERRAQATGKTFVFTCAQNNTDVHAGFLHNLVQYAKFRDAELHISRFMYNKNALAAADSKVSTTKKTDDDDTWYDPRITPYLSDQSLQITSDLVWCGELNILPTRIDPLSTMLHYTREASGIIPHVKMRMQSVPTMKHEAAKTMYTTGAVTKRNYIQRVAGQVAEFHHVFGALVVEVDNEGTWWARQINADANGDFYDLDTFWSAGGPQDGIRMQAITHGDLHGFKIDTEVFDAVFREGGILDRLMPREQFFHDTIDFMPRNHHNIKDPHFLYEMHMGNTPSVQQEFVFAADLLEQAHRPWCRMFVVESNHDAAIKGWLRNHAAFYDPVNMKFWLDMNLRCVYAMDSYTRAKPFYWAIKDALMGRNVPFVFLAEDDSHKILGVIEAALHGHLGPNGARGSPKNLRTAGKANTGHTHSPGIVDGVYTAGVYGKLDMGYNTGLSSWGHAFIVTYPNAKRAIFTIKNGKAWRDV